MLSSEIADLKDQKERLEASNVSFQGLVKELTQQICDKEQGHEDSLRKAREDLVALQKQLRDNSALGNVVRVDLPGLSRGKFPERAKKVTKVAREFSLEVVRKMPCTEMFIQFSELVRSRQ